jgi:dephospho-CoA kinase
MSFRLGLTGSIGMGKSTTAAMFADEGIPVWDADAAVHRLYAPGQPAALAVAALFPDVIDSTGRVDRPRLRAMIGADPTVLDQLDAAVHPLVAEDRASFLRANETAPVVLLDVPLLFETGLDSACDAVAVVSASREVQRERVLMRGMTETEFMVILSRQVSDAEKRARAAARAAVKDVLADIAKRIAGHA